MPFDRGLVHAARAAEHDAKIIAKRQADACTNGAVYKAPAAGAAVDCSKKVRIEWDKNCFNTPPRALDIQLWGTKHLATYKEVNFEPGFYEADFQPTWCVSATPGSSAQLSMYFIPSDALPWMIPFGESAPFSASNPVDPTPTQAPTDTSTSTASSVPTEEDQPFIVTVKNFFKGLAPGSIAAAVIIPLLAVAVAIAIYIKFSRAKQAEKRKRFSEAVDKRMSTISTDWKSISGAGASAAIRHSMAATGRASMYGRPSASVYGGSIYGEDNFPPGVDASAIGTLGVGARPPMQHLRPQDRVSRVSFATESVYSRPSMGDAIRPGMSTRAFQYAHDIPVPPLPTARPSIDDGSPVLSPTQTQGPFSLSPEEIRARVGGPLQVSSIQEEEYGRPSIDADFNREVLNMPAISLMRTNESSADNDFLVANTPSPIPSSAGLTPPSPVHTNPAAVQQSPLGMMPFMQSPTSVAAASPDDMLRAYAEQRRAAGGAPSTGMRTLYAPTMMQRQEPMVGAPGYRQSVAPTEWSENEMEDANKFGRAA